VASEEAKRLKEDAEGKVPWKKWGPYLSERAWGTVREDYSADGNAWMYFPVEHAPSRAYRWNEEGLAGVSDDNQFLCLALSLWNGKDPILKERIFGLANPFGNHGEDVKDYYFYVDSTPTHSWMVWRYMYPQREFPYQDLVETNQNRSKAEPEYELADTGVFEENRYWEITCEYAKGGPDDICMVITVHNMGPDEATIHVLPTLWFRNTWSWGRDAYRPHVKDQDGQIVAGHQILGTMLFSGDGRPETLFCENETNNQRLWGSENRTPYPKDGIQDHVISGAPTVNPKKDGTKGAFHYTLTVPGGDTAQVRVRLSRGEDVSEGFDEIYTARKAEADDFYKKLTPRTASDDEGLVMRQAFAGMLWSKQFFHYDVDDWLDGDPAAPPPPESRKRGRNADWKHLDNFDVISMPDKWEYPWYAAWDLAFHCVVLAHVDPDFAKGQLLLMLKERYQHPNGQIPAYEWNFSDVNPPVHSWAAHKVFEIDGGKDYKFLARVFHKLIVNFTWWVTKKDRDGNNVFEGGFLGLDNIGPIDRSAVLEGGHLEQSDGTSWMAKYCLDLLRMALTLAEKDDAYRDIANKFFEHFCFVATGINSAGLSHGLWDEQDGFYYDLLRPDVGEPIPLRVRSMVGLLTLLAVDVLHGEEHAELTAFISKPMWFLSDRLSALDAIPHIELTNDEDEHVLSIVSPPRLRRILERMLDEREFLSSYGIRALSAIHGIEPCIVDVFGFQAEVRYEPAESSTGMFGGNSNWRGPIWMPVNYLLIESLRRFHDFLGDDFKVEHPTGSGLRRNLGEVADDISRRIVRIFTRGSDGRRPVFGDNELFQSDPAWRDLVPFYEYFDGDTGRGVGATHQTGWTGLVADLIVTGAGCAASEKKPTKAKAVRTRKPRAKVKAKAGAG
jgi:hypothetical protein